MHKFAIYSYKLVEKPIRNFDLSLSEPVENLSLDKRFELLFGKDKGAEVIIQKVNKNLNAEKFPCQVICHEFGVILLRLVNDKQVDIWEEKESTSSPISKIEKTKKQTKPYCYVVIDTRPDSHIIAIESGSAAWRNTSVVRELLQNSFNHLLGINDYGLEVTVLSKMLPSNFWDYVDKKRKKDNVYIKSMTFSFINHKHRPDINIKTALSSDWKRFESFMNMIDGLGGDRGEIKIVPSKNEALMKRRLADITHMVEICANSNYSLSITFSDDVTYRCNQELKAELPMDEKTRIDFERGYYDLFGGSGMLIWLDDVKHKTEGYNDIDEIRRKPGRKVKKNIS